MPRNKYGYFWLGLAVATFVAHLSVARAADGDFPAADKAAIKAYVLTVNKLNGYIAGTTALAGAKNADRALAAEIEKMEDEPGGDACRIEDQDRASSKSVRVFSETGLEC